MSDFVTPFSEQIWDMKYRYKDANQIPIDKVVTDSWSRVAKSLASVEENSKKWEKIFYSALEDFKFLPAGRILAGAGTGRSVTLFNCFVMGTCKLRCDTLGSGSMLTFWCQHSYLVAMVPSS